MSTSPWVITLGFVAANGNVTQAYPAYAAAGVQKGGVSDVLGASIRCPVGGLLHSIEVKPDGSNAGALEIYDIDGNDAGADVSSNTAITDTQLDALIAAGKAKLLWTQSFAGTVGSGPKNAAGVYRQFSKGLGLRFVAAAGACTVTLNVTDGFQYRTSAGV